MPPLFCWDVREWNAEERKIIAFEQRTIQLCIIVWETLFVVQHFKSDWNFSWTDWNACCR